VAAAAERAQGSEAAWLRERSELLRYATEPVKHRSLATDEKLHDFVLQYPDKRFATSRAANTSLSSIR